MDDAAVYNIITGTCVKAIYLTSQLHGNVKYQIYVTQVINIDSYLIHIHIRNNEKNLFESRKFPFLIQ